MKLSKEIGKKKSQRLILQLNYQCCRLLNLSTTLLLDLKPRKQVCYQSLEMGHLSQDRRNPAGES